MREFKNRVAVVTGAASGIGRAMAGRFAAEGMRVVLADIEQQALDRAAGQLRDDGATVLAVPTDVSRAEDIEVLADATMTEFGAVHVLCNNAGVGIGSDFAKIPLSTWEWVLGVDLWGVIHGCRTFLPLLAEQEEAHMSSFAKTSQATLGPALDAALDPERVAGVVLDAIRGQRFYILPHPEEAIDMAEQQLRWMRTNEPLVPGPGVARAAD
jgi:NAD(P)-dependent dehydrogenase (short-subunit alcohol dehydrogenase family)